VDSHADLLNLPYRQFDQTQGSGWHTLAKQRKYREAAVLIEAYLPRHPELAPHERALLNFHSAQGFGLAGDTRAALRHLKHAPLEGDPPRGFWPKRNWHDYIAATRAFMMHDRNALLAARDHLSSGPSTVFLDVIEKMVSHLGESYADVFLPP